MSKSFSDQPPTDTLKYECVAFRQRNIGVGYAVVAECPPNSDLELVSLCQAGVGGTWSPLGWPVYDQKTKLRYDKQLYFLSITIFSCNANISKLYVFSN